MIFPYTDESIQYLARKDKRLAAAMLRIGRIERDVIPDVFCAMVNSIVGQQISAAAHRTVWARVQQVVGDMRPEHVLSIPDATLQGAGISYKKVSYIKGVAERIVCGALDVFALQQAADAEIIHALTACSGIGQWTAEMLLIFCFCRPNVLSFGDFGIRRGLCMLYGHKELSKARFEVYQKRYAPYASVASLYLWAVAGGQ